jgi:hypothetical protein
MTKTNIHTIEGVSVFLFLVRMEKGWERDAHGGQEEFRHFEEPRAVPGVHDQQIQKCI